MIDRLPLLALVALASLPAAAATDASRNYGVSGFDRIRVDGPYQINVHTGVAPFARATAAKSAALDSVTLKVEGRTLVVRKSSGSWGGYPGEGNGPVLIDIGTHDLNTLWLNGAGSVEIDHVKGQTFDLSVQGAGSARIGALQVDELKVALTGSGTARLAGKALKVTAVVRGSSNLDGDGLASNDVVIGAEGPSLVRLNARSTAKVDAMGLASVSLGGRPACTTKAQGSATVAGCK